MSQFGMQMTGAQRRRASGPDVYTALAVLAAVFLAAACAVMFKASAAVGKDGSPFGIWKQGDRIDLK
jgi:hypothetical protein